MAGREETVDDREILRFISDHEDLVVTTSEVAEFLDFSNAGTLKRLHALHEDGYLGYKDAKNIHIWWLSDAGQEYLESVEVS